MVVKCFNNMPSNYGWVFIGDIESLQVYKGQWVAEYDPEIGTRIYARNSDDEADRTTESVGDEILLHPGKKLVSVNRMDIRFRSGTYRSYVVDEKMDVYLMNESGTTIEKIA